MVGFEIYQRVFQEAFTTPGTATEWTLCGRVPRNEILEGPYINLKDVSVGPLIVGDSAYPISLGL